MSQTITKIKSRINTVNSAYKVTSAMKLVSSVKLRSYKSKMLASKAFRETLLKTINDVLIHFEDVESNFLNGNKDIKKNLYIVISSSLGLCGAYNSNIFHLADVKLAKEDDAIILGKKGLIHFENGEFTDVDNFKEYNSIKDSKIIRDLSEFVINEYKKNKYNEVHIIYTEYINPIAFISKDMKLLPLNNFDNKESHVGYEPLFEPNKQNLLENLVPFVVKSVIKSCLLESEVCEHASRSNAMENATANAEELLDELKIEFNKARQGAITQEIIEIAAAANAL